MKIIRDHRSREKQVLDIQQLQIIGMYEKLLNEKNIYRYLNTLGSRGYMTCFEKRDDKVVFTGLQNRDSFSSEAAFFQKAPLDIMYEDKVIFFCKKLLTAWHKKEGIKYETRKSTDLGQTVSSELTHEQRGVLTKILKMENKRKRLMKR